MRSLPKARSARSRGASGCCGLLSQRYNGHGGHAKVFTTDVEPAYLFWPPGRSLRDAHFPRALDPIGPCQPGINHRQSRTRADTLRTGKHHPPSSQSTPHLGLPGHPDTPSQDICCDPPFLLHSSQRREVAIGHVRRVRVSGLRGRGGIVASPVDEELVSPRATRTREHQRQFRGMPPIPQSG